MKSILPFLLMVGIVAGQGARLPSCATSCVTRFTTGTEVAGCQQLDIGCICSNQNFLSDIACCLAGTCDEAGQREAVEYARQICSAQGVATPDEVECRSASSSGGSSQTSSSGSSSATGAAASTETTSSESTGSASAATTSSTENADSGAGGLGGAGGLMGAGLAMLLAL